GAAFWVKAAGVACYKVAGVWGPAVGGAGGGAAAAFARMVAALGGPADFVEKPEKYLPKAAVEFAVKAAGNGFATGIATRDIGLAVVGLGGGRTRPDDRIDHAVGITRLLPLGAEVRTGEPLALVHARTQAEAEAAAAAVLSAYTIGASKPAADKTVIRRVLPRG
ncbi:thymidine phosphorylase, partial [Mesorhizobium sp. M1305]